LIIGRALTLNDVFATIDHPLNRSIAARAWSSAGDKLGAAEDSRLPRRTLQCAPACDQLARKHLYSIQRPDETTVG
jgi:hypothetical protein